MEKIKIAVKDNSACLLSPVKLIAGTKGQECEFFFDEVWQTYKDILVKFKKGERTYGPYALYEKNIFIIPSVVLEEPGDVLEVGLIGNSRIPTSWCHIGKVLSGADDEPGCLPDEDDNIVIIYDGGVIE